MSVTVTSCHHSSRFSQDKQVLFLTNSSASPDSQTNKAKIRDYNIDVNYLRSNLILVHPMILLLTLILILLNLILILIPIPILMVILVILILILLREEEQRVGSWEEAGKFYSVPGIRITLTTR